MSSLFGWDLPPGCRESDCEPYDPACASCGCDYSMHYEARDEEVIPDKCKRDSESYYNAVQYNANGEVEHACDSLLSRGEKRIQCHCTGFVEGEYEPDYEDDGN